MKKTNNAEGERDVYRLLEFIDTDIEAYEIVSLDNFTKKRWKKRIRKKVRKKPSMRFTKPVMVASMLLTLFVFSKYTSVGVELVIDTFHNIIGSKNYIELNKNPIDKTCIYKDTALTLSDFILTDKEIVMKGEMNISKDEYKNRFKKKDFPIGNVTIYLNGNELSGHRKSYSWFGNESVFEESESMEYDDGFNTSVVLSSKNKDSSQQLTKKGVSFFYTCDVKAMMYNHEEFTNILYENETVKVRLEFYIEGEKDGWIYEFQTDLLNEKIMECNLNEKRESDDGTLVRFNQIKINPYKIEINFKASKEWGYNYGLVMEDNLGNVMYSSLKSNYNSSASENIAVRWMARFNNLISDKAEHVSIWIFKKNSPEVDENKNEVPVKLGSPVVIHFN